MCENLKKHKYQISLISNANLETSIYQLKNQGFLVDQYDSMPKQLETWYANPDTIIIDIQGVDNWKLEFNKLQNTAQFKHLPVILFCKEELSFKEAKHALELGVFSCISFQLSGKCSLKILSACKNWRCKKELLEDNQALNRHLSSNYLIIDSKNRFINSLKDRLYKLLDQPLDRLSSGIHEISLDIDKNIKNDYQYQLFMIPFKEVHPLFFKKLMYLGNNLTENNMKLLAFLKMGFNNNEIAFLLNVSIATVKKHIQRLKSKLNLQPEESLRALIFNIESLEVS